jgi:biotin carboxyl carrier protein
MSSDPSDFAAARATLIEACAEMERRLHGLRDSQGQVVDEIHQLRRLGKRLRGGLAMVGEAKPCLRWLAVIGRMLGASRDATVRARTWKKLGFEAPTAGSVEAAIAGLLELEADAARRLPPQEVVDWSLSARGHVRSRLEVRTEVETAEAAARGESVLRRQLRKRLKRALQRVRNEDFHDCRKAAKAWLGGLSLVAAGREVGGMAEAGQLGDSLGEENDLEVLAAGRVRRAEAATPAPAAVAEAPEPGLVAVASPMEGSVWSRPNPGAAPLAALGARVEAGETIALVEVMKTFTPVRAPQAGVLVAFTCADGDPVSAGAPVAWLRP